MEMETMTLKEPHKSGIKKSKDEFYIIDNYDNLIGKLTYILSNGTKAVFENGNNKYIFEKNGFWKNNIQVRPFGKENVLYDISYNWRSNTSVITLNNGTQIALKHGEIFGNYWEWQNQTTIEPLIGYTIIPDFKNLISVKVLTNDDQNFELNLICALGYFILLKY